MQYAHTTSWGVSTRLIGAMIMTHSDDDGFVAPPRLAPQHIVVLPIYKDDASKAQVLEYCESLKKELTTQRFHDRKLVVTIDNRDLRGGEKAWGWIKKGVPLRVEVGPRDIASGSVFVARRDTGEKAGIPRTEFVSSVISRLQSIQDNLLAKAKAHRAENTREINSWEELKEFFTPKNANDPEMHGGFALCHWNGSKEVERRLKDELKVTIRCIALDAKEEAGKCVVTGEPSLRRVVMAKAY
jgi:prolyl-tRNA synthetase